MLGLLTPISRRPARIGSPGHMHARVDTFNVSSDGLPMVAHHRTVAEPALQHDGDGRQEKEEMEDRHPDLDPLMARVRHALIRFPFARSAFAFVAACIWEFTCDRARHGERRA